MEEASDLMNAGNDGIPQRGYTLGRFILVVGELWRL